MTETDVSFNLGDGDPAPAAKPPAKEGGGFGYNKGDLIIPRGKDELLKFAEMAIKSGLVPSAYKTPPQLVVGLQYAKEIGMPGLTALRQIAVVQGTPTIFGDLPLAMVQRSGLLSGFEEELLDRDYQPIAARNKNLDAPIFAAVCRAERKGVGKKEAYFTAAMAQAAGLAGRQTYRQWPHLMYKYRARSEVLKTLFPDILSGTAIAEYDKHELPGTEGPYGQYALRLDDEAGLAAPAVGGSS